MGIIVFLQSHEGIFMIHPMNCRYSRGISPNRKSHRKEPHAYLHGAQTVPPTLATCSPGEGTTWGRTCLALTGLRSHRAPQGRDHLAQPLTLGGGGSGEMPKSTENQQGRTGTQATRQHMWDSMRGSLKLGSSSLLTWERGAQRPP